MDTRTIVVIHTTIMINTFAIAVIYSIYDLIWISFIMFVLWAFIISAYYWENEKWMG
jgi:hypothetical protein